MMIRYFCVVAPGAIGDVGYAYLRALADTGIEVRALPIGPASALGTEKRWYDAGKLFTTPMSIPFVNVVCAPLGLQLGARAPMNVMGGTRDLVKQEGNTTDVMVFPAELREILGPQKDASQIIYEPQTAFGGLHTTGCTNVAIVLPGSMSAAELAALERYDLVISAQSGWGVALGGVKARYVPPESGELAAALEEACASGTSVITGNLPVMGERPAITWLRSSASMESSLKSQASATPDASHPRPDTKISTSSSSPGIRSRAQQTWRSITQRLAFWRRSSP